LPQSLVASELLPAAGQVMLVAPDARWLCSNLVTSVSSAAPRSERFDAYAVAESGSEQLAMLPPLLEELPLAEPPLAEPPLEELPVAELPVEELPFELPPPPQATTHTSTASPRSALTPTIVYPGMRQRSAKLDIPPKRCPS
jgi:hypothetical protein